MIPEETIRKVKEEHNVYEVVSEYVKLKKEGADYKGLCPFHNEKSASFSISVSKNIYKCFGCGKSGNGITFLMEHVKMTFIEAIKHIAEKNNIEIEEAQTVKNFIKPVARLEKIGAKALSWFENERKISNNTVLRFGITEAREWMPQLKAETTVICFNYYKAGEVVNIKFRGPEKSFKMAKDAELIFYNLQAIENESECVVVEGELDALALYEAGIYNAVSVPNGASVGSQKLEYLDNCWKNFEDKTKVVLFLDNDGPGNKLKDELARRLGYEKCWYVDPIDGCKDANDVLIQHGSEILKNSVLLAKRWPMDGLVLMDDMYEQVVDYYENGYPMGITADIPEFDPLLSFYPGQLTIITGSPGSGKSEFLDWLMARIAKIHKWEWGICSFECPPPIHVTKLAEKFTDKAFAYRKDPNQRMTRMEFDYAIGMIDKYFHFINLSLITITMEGLIKKAEELVKMKGIKGLLFDPWNCIEAKYSGENETKYVLECLNMLIAFAEKYKVHVFLVAHPTKLRRDQRTGKLEIPNLYSISGSAHFFNRTHNGISVYRDFATNTVDIYVQKVKWSWLGKIGFCSFNYDTLTRSYNRI